MKGATQCAKRLKTLFRTLRSELGAVPRPTSGDPVTQLILGIFSRDLPESKARDALSRLHAEVVDYNELRVVPAFEVAKWVSDVPQARLKCEDLSRALNAIFATEHAVTLEHLGEKSKKEVNEYLEGIDGADPYSRARARLLGLGLHAIPLDEAMWAYARESGIIDDKCPLEEAQAFLERQINEDDALEFVALLEKQAWAKKGPAVRKREVEPILSAPPDRTTRNMLQLVAGGGDGAAAATPPAATSDPAPKPEAAEPATAPEEKPAPARKKAAQPRKAAKTKAAAPKKTKRTAAASTPKRSKTAAPKSAARKKTTKKSTAKRKTAGSKSVTRRKSPKRTSRTKSGARSG